MSSSVETENEIETEEEKKVKGKKEEKDIEKVTDYREEKENTQLSGSLLTLAAEAESAKPPVLIHIAQADVLVLIEECEITKEQAEILLRKNKGDLKCSLIAYVRGCNGAFEQ